ncbi:MAG TPA: hypothetical protein VKF83_02925 [Stellaceae bacterium]|nr:hypothetical protein [Stellaceae bacterium]HMD62913.1 hypothetical protein [Stellaceae bacterium]
MNFRSALAAITAPLSWRAVLVLMAALPVAAEWIAPRELAQYAPALGTAINVPPQGSPAAAPSAGTYPAIAAHPLFYPTRQPWAAPPPPAAAPATAQTGPTPLANYILSGVVITNANRVALLKSSNTAKTIALAEGRELDGWTLREISRERLRFESGSATYDMSFPLAQKPAR